MIMMMTTMGKHSLDAAVVLPLALSIILLSRLDFVIAQGVPRTFSTRPFRGGPPQFATAVLEGSAALPCDIQPPGPNDSYILVVWYKQDVNPIYSYDIRAKQSQKTPEWMSDYLKNRATFRKTTKPALIINRVEKGDEGEYRCRVDFMKNPTRNSRVQLNVIIPPEKPRILNEYDKPVDLVAGPYREDGELELKCLVSGGQPEPTVRWYRGGMLLDDKDEPGSSPNVRQNTLRLRKLDRLDLNAKFTCQASNTNLSLPVSASVAIEMHLRPLNVSILSSGDAPLSAGRKYEINCMTVGSRPPANLTWFRDRERLGNYTNKISPDGNMTTSVLTIVPTVQDNDKVITCRAENNKVKGGAVEDSAKLNVYYAPTLNLSLGSKLNPNDIEEGDDVYFDCIVDANPKAYKVVWKHNGNVLQYNQKLGMIVQQNSLALRSLKRSQAGNYTCIASNVEGDGTSNSIELKIMFKPICAAEQKRVYGVALHEEASVVCNVEAYPAPTSFHWAFNNTEKMVEVPKSLYQNSSGQSQNVLTYKPVSDSDYGTVLCWANNAPGPQDSPCSFHIISAGKPEPPYNCTLTNQTTQSLAVECTAGFDGGQAQHFQLEVFDQQTGQLRANLSSRDTAGFSVQELEPGRVLRMAVYAVNARGRSEATLLEGFTLKVAEKQTGSPVPFELTPLLGILLGLVAALLLCALTVLLALKVRSERRGAPRPGDLPLKKATLPSAEELYDADDRNPDVVPSNKDSDYQLTGSTAGTPLAVQPTPDAQPSHLLAPAYSRPDYSSYPTLPLSGEVTYAELCLARPSTLTTAAGGADGKLASIAGLGSLAGFSSGGVGGGVKPSYAKEATVYACIDHNARPAKIDPPPSSGMQQPAVNANPAVGAVQQHPREVVTVRTPLISSQESCV